MCVRTRAGSAGPVDSGPFGVGRMPHLFPLGRFPSRRPQGKEPPMTSSRASSAGAGAAAASGSTHAIVIGGSMAGLLTARVLAGHLDRVTLIERDALPDEAEHRKGVPQSRQLHALLARGLQIIERLFPGYRADLLAAGAVPVRLPADLRMLTPFGWLDRRPPAGRRCRRAGRCSRPPCAGGCASCRT